MLPRERFEVLKDFATIRWRKCANPTVCYLFIAPVLARARIIENHQMEMVAHDGVGHDFNGEVVGEVKHSFGQPDFTVAVVLAGAGIFTAKPAAAYTARDQMIVKGNVWIDE